MKKLVTLSILIGCLCTAATASAKIISTKTTITMQPPQWAHKGLVGVTFVGRVSADGFGSAGCTMGRKVVLFMDVPTNPEPVPIGQPVYTGSWRGHSQGYWNITVNLPGRAFTKFYAIARYQLRSPSYAKPDQLACGQGATPGTPPRW